MYYFYLPLAGNELISYLSTFQIRILINFVMKIIISTTQGYP